MSFEPDAVLRRLDELERRMGAMENWLVTTADGVKPNAPSEEVAARPTTARGLEKRAIVAEIAQAEQVVAKSAAPPAEHGLDADVGEIFVMQAPAPAVLTPQARTDLGAERRVSAPPTTARADSPRASGLSDSLSLERLIGGRFYAAIGAVVVVVGVGMFLRLAVQRGWFSFPPMARCLSAAGFGMALLVAGEVARKKISAAASVGLSAAGIATVWASGLAAWGLYKLVGPAAAFVVLAGVSAMGVGVALRARQALLAGLSLVAAYLTPIVLWRGDLAALVMPTYLLAVLGFGLWLSGWRPTPFRSVRRIVWWGTLLLGSAWVLEQAQSHAFLAIVFLGAVWIAVHAELVFGAVRQPESQNDWSERYSELWREARPVVTSFATTIWAAGLGVLAARLGRTGVVPPDWFVPAGGFVGACIGGLLLAGALRVLRDTPDTDAERLGAGLMVQSGALLIATVAMAVGSWMQTVAWLAMGVAGVFGAKWIRSRPLSVYGLILLGLGVVRLAVWDWWHTPPTGVAVLGLFLTRWSLLMVLAGVACAAAGVTLWWKEKSGGWRGLGEMCVAVAWTLVMGSVLHPTDAVAAVGFVGAGVCLGLLVTAAVMKSERLLLVMAGFCAWVSVGALMVNVGRMSQGMSVVGVGGLVLTPLSGVMAAMACVWIAVAAVVWKRARMGALACVAIAWTLAFGAVMHVGAHAAALGTVATVVCAGVLGTAWWLRSRGLGQVGLWYVALTSVWMVIEYQTPGLAGAGMQSVGLLGLEFDGLSAVVGLIGAVWVMAALVWRGWSKGAVIGCVLGAATMAMLLPRLEGSANESVCLWWLAVSVGLVGLHAVWPRVRMDVMGLCGLGISALAWAVVWPLSGWMNGVNAEGIHGGFWVAIGWCVGAGVSAVWLGREWGSPSLHGRWGRRASGGTLIAGGGTLLVFFVATSFEVARVAGLLLQDRTSQAAAVSIWWGIYAAVLLAIGFVGRMAPVRHVGLGLLGVATAKAVVFDLAEVGAEWRVASFLGLGMMMLGVAVVYGRVSKRLEATSA